MSRWGVGLVGCLLSVVLAGTVAWASDPPVVVQPNAAGFSAAERTEFDGAYQQLTKLLRSQELGPQKRLAQDGWDVADFAAFTAGALARLGYDTVVVEQQDAGATRVWVLVSIDLGTRTIWVPVEPLPNPDLTQKTLGAVATSGSAGGTILFDASYLSYGRIIELPANVPPTARIVIPVGDVVELVSVAWFANASFDSDGTIVLYQWTFDGEVQRVTAHVAQWYTFPMSGTYTVSLTVTDNRGAQATTSVTLYVLKTEEAGNECGCGG